MREIVNVNRRRDFSTPPMQTWVVDPKGRIRTISYDYNVGSPMLQVETVGNNGVASITLTSMYEREGFRLLSDMYRDENNMEGFQDFKDWSKAREEGRLGRVEHKQEDVRGQPPVVFDVYEPFPDELLPKAVLERRQKTDKRNIKWTPPSKAKAPQKAAKSA